MYSFRSSLAARFFALIAITLFIFPLTEIPAQGKSDTPSEFKIKKLKYFVPGHRIQMDVQVTDPAGVSQVRCYFRAQSQDSFLFVQMRNYGDNWYSGILPAPSRETPYIEYLYLAVNGVNKVTKTQTLVVEQKDDDETPGWQEVSSEGDVNVYTELAEAPETIAGFSDSIVTDVVVSSSRFGFTTTGIYTASEISGAGGAAGAAATSTSGGTAGVSAGGLSTGAIVGISAAAAAVVAGTVYVITDEDDPPRINHRARIQWGDCGSESTVADDAFQVWFAGRYLGESPTGGSSGMIEVSGLEVGTHELEIKFVTPYAGGGSYCINLEIAHFTDGGTYRDGIILDVDDSEYFQVTVPEQ